MQTTVNTVPLRAIPGQLGDSGHDMFIRSFAIEGITGNFGLAVVPGTDPLTQCKVPTVGGVVLGFIASQQALEDEDGAADLANGETASIVAKGRIWVVAAEAMATTDTIYVEDATGEIRNDVTAATILPNSKVHDYDADTGLALISIGIL